MGVLADLNMSSVNRLRHTIARVKAALQTLGR
jgi:ribosomal protein L29